MYLPRVGYEGESKGKDCESTMCQCTTLIFAYVSESMKFLMVCTGSKWRLLSSRT